MTQEIDKNNTAFQLSTAGV